jgi:exodeoxyribonuclease V beta subunit
MLATLLFGDRGPDGALVAGASAPKLGDLDDAVTSTRLADLVERGQGGIEALVVPAQLGVAVQGRAPVVERAPLETARLDRDVHEPDVWRWSFTGLLRPLPGRAAGAGPAAAGRSDVGADDAGPDVAGDDEPDVVPTLEDDLDTGVGAGGDGGDAVRGEAAARGPLVDLPGGTSFGVLVHEALEAVDLSLEPADVTIALRDELTARAARSGVPVDVERVAEGLALALDTPLEPILPGLRLRDVAAVDRIPELVFELPVADTHARVTLSALADAVSGALAADDPYRDAFATLPERLDRARFAGWLTGVVDLALRTEDGRYVVADYKSNRLTGLDGLPAYDASAMHAAMLHGEYPLQALLYLVGLHRILGRRLAGYDPAVHLGGAAFLFVRGMVGTGTPLRDGVRDGVCVWRPQVAAVLAADAVLRGGAR